MASLGGNIVAVLHSHDCREFAHQLEYHLSTCLKNYTSDPQSIEFPQTSQVELVHNIVQIAVLLISRQLLTERSQFDDFVETLILRNNTPQYVIWLCDDFRKFGTLVSHQYPTLEAPAKWVLLCSNEEALTIAQDITTVLCKLTGEMRMACYKSLENTQQFLYDNMDLHHVLKRLEQDNQLSPDDVQFIIKEKPRDWLKDIIYQDSYDLLGYILKEAGQDFLVKEIEDSERNEEEAVREVMQPVQAGHIGFDNQLYKMSRDLGKEWKRLGRELGLEQETLGRIQEDYRRSEQHTQRAFQVLKLWYTKSNKGPLQFLPQLEEALNAMRKRSQADDIGDLNEKYQEKTVVNPETGDMKWSVHLTGNEGIYLCKRTNLGVVTPCKLHVSYWWENWSAHEWKEEDKEKWRPVGPMFSIKCEEMEGPVDILLPHVLHLSENEASAINTEDFKVVHIVEGTAELLSTTEVTTTHVITRFKKGSVFGPIMRSDHGKDYPTNGLFVVFAPVNLSPKCQIHVYMMSNAVHIVEYLATIEEKDGYKKWDQEAYMLQTGKNYTMDVILGENGNVPIRADPQEGLIFHVTLETGIYYKKFRVQVKVNGPMIIQDVQVKDADNDDNAAVCMVLTEAGNIAQHEENAGNSHSGPAKKDVTSIHAQIVRPPDQTWHSGRQSTVLLMIDEYDPSTCETSTINYQLVCMLIEAGVKVYCIVLVKPRSEVMEDVELLLPKRDVGDHRKPSITWLTFDHRTRYPNLPEGITHIVGHVDITSQAANAIKEQRLPAYVKVILFYHVIPEDEDYYRGNEEAMGIASKKKSICKDAAKADILFSVGPKVHDYYENEHRGIQPTPQHHLFLPEPPSIFRDTQVKYVETKRKVVLSIGPVKGAEMLKGFDLAAGAMSIVITEDPDTIWQVRNISEDDFQESKEKIKVHTKSGSVKFTPHPYGTQQELCEDLKKAHLVLMPSRAEPFGMVGLQAIAAGVPILTSSSSGLAKFVMEYAPMFRHSIVEITDSETDTIKATKELAKRITKRLTDSKAEFQEAARIREDLLESKYWMESKQLFLQVCDACEP